MRSGVIYIIPFSRLCRHLRRGLLLSAVIILARLGARGIILQSPVRNCDHCGCELPDGGKGPLCGDCWAEEKAW